MIIAAADGSSLSNPGPAGWAWFVDGDRWRAGGWKHGTNNMGELMAVLDLLEQTAGAGDDLLVYCDSQYVINAVTKWMPGWKRKGWKKADGKPVLNVELLQGIDRAIAGRRVTFEWVKGHAGHELNEAADARARAAATAYQRGAPVDEGPGFAADVITSGSLDVTPGARAEPDLLDALAEGGDDADEHPVVGVTRALLSDALRSDRDGFASHLHPHFVLHDERGRAAGKGRLLATLGPLPEPVRVEVEGVDVLAPWIVQVRWRARSASAVTLRSSLWVKHDGSWRLRFEQATPAVR
ncbi:ribonuclease HI family protein [Propioniciclava soli]|uniref:ribonuclease HI family protein n=1 Tax=Propioniciclava soli TaxID=2775081 RepID=UPI001E2AA812